MIFYDDTILKELREIREILGRFAPNRRNPSPDTMTQHIFTCDVAYNGNCPSCLARQIVENGRRLQAVSQLDHWENRSANRPHQTWLICISCHSQFSRGIWSRKTRLEYFSAYQLRREALYEGRQGTLSLH